MTTQNARPSRVRGVAFPNTPHLAGLWAAGPLAVAAFAVSLLLRQAEIPFTGPDSMQTRLFVVSLLGAPLAYLTGHLFGSGGRERQAPFDWIRFAARAAALTIGISMLTTLVIPLIAQAFVGYLFPWFWGAVTAGAYGLLLGYVCAALGFRRWVGDLVLLAVLVALLGVLTSAALSGEEQWWTTAISALGTAWSASWRIFDVACVSAGAILLLASTSASPVARAAADEGVAAPATARWFAPIMATSAILLSLVGLFPMDGTEFEFLLHNIGGIGFGVLLFVAMALTWRSFPGVPREFIWYSWAFAALTALATLAFRPLRVFSLAELEVVAFGLEGLWAIMLFATLRDGFKSAERPTS